MDYQITTPLVLTSAFILKILATELYYCLFSKSNFSYLDFALSIYHSYKKNNSLTNAIISMIS